MILSLILWEQIYEPIKCTKIAEHQFIGTNFVINVICVAFYWTILCQSPQKRVSFSWGLSCRGSHDCRDLCDHEAERPGKVCWFEIVCWHQTDCERTCSALCQIPANTHHANLLAIKFNLLIDDRWISKSDQKERTHDIF